MTLAGLEVAEVEKIGVEGAELPWDADKIVIGNILEVKQHPNADRLVLADVDYGAAEPHTVVTGAPNLFQYRGQGRLAHPLKGVFAREGATLYDGHAEGQGQGDAEGPPGARGHVRRHALLGEGAGAFRRARGHSDPARRRAGGYAAARVSRRRGARHRHPAEHGPRALDPGGGARGGRPDRRQAARAGDAARRERAERRGTRARDGRGARSLPALQCHADRGRDDRPIAAVDAAPADSGRHAADLQYRRRVELRDAGAGPAKPHLRRRQGRRPAPDRAPGSSGRADDHARRQAARPVSRCRAPICRRCWCAIRTARRGALPA